MRSFRSFVVLTAIMGCCTPHVATAIKPPTVNRERGRAALIIQDVELNRGNKLTVQVSDAQGKPHAGTPITVRKAGAAIHHSVTGKDGQVVVPQVKPGVYEITSGSRGGIYRVWAPQTAPPRASAGILLVNDGQVVRGQNWQNAALIGGVIITSGVVGGVIGYNVKDAS